MRPLTEQTDATDHDKSAKAKEKEEPQRIQEATREIRSVSGIHR